MKFKAVIFDFDGTVCETAPGVVKSAKYALESFGYPVPEDEHELEFFIGPPLLVTFQERFGADPQRALELVKNTGKDTQIRVYTKARFTAVWTHCLPL